MQTFKSHAQNVYRLLFIPVLLFNILSASAQFFDTGQDPSFIRWNQINTTHFKIIFPSDFQKEANHLATIMDYIFTNVNKSFNHTPGKITVILHTHSSSSNGLVTWAPKRMELYTTPPQDNYAQEWLDQLAVHEMRHVVQIDNLNQGLTRIISYLFGQQFVGALTAFIPRWLLEGDAVNNETSLTSTGRGRLGSFEMEMKAQVTCNAKLYTYDKAYFGSYKNYVPDYYHMGYPVVAWSRKTFNASSKDTSLDFLGRAPVTMFDLPFGIHHFTKHNKTGLYKLAYTDLKKEWLNQLASIPKDSTIVPWNRTDKKDYTNYRLPQVYTDTTVVTIKTGMDNIPRFILLSKSGLEKTLATPGNYASDKLSFACGKLVWAEEIPDIRWENQSFNCIKICDITSGKTRIISSHSRYFAPAISLDGKRIVTIEVSTGNEFYVVILDAGNGKVLDKIPAPENSCIQQPEWTKDGASILLLSTTKEGKSLITLNPSSHSFLNLTSPTYHNLGLPTDDENYIYYEADYNSIPNIYALCKKDHSIWQVTQAQYGAFAPSILYKNTLVYSRYGVKGYDVVAITINPATFIASSQIADRSVKLWKRSSSLENFNFQDSTIIPKTYPVTSYSKMLHLVNVHSWAPFYVNYDNLNIFTNDLSPGVSLLSQNQLGTMFSSFGYKYQNGFSYEQAHLTFKGWYPVISVTLNYGGPIQIYKTKETKVVPTSTNDRFSANYLVYLPLNLTRGPVITSFLPGIEWDYQDLWMFNHKLKRYHNGFSTISYFATAYKMLKTSVRDIHPRWGIIVEGKVQTAPFSDIYGTMSSLQCNFYTPGVLPHHSLKIATAIQHQKQWYYNSHIAFPRGVQEDTTLNLVTYSLDYEFPVMYPDFSVGSFVYVKRIRADIFGDGAVNKYISEKKIPVSKSIYTAGLDLTADFYLLRLIFPMNAGIRTVYIPRSGKLEHEFLFRININSF